MASNKKIDLTKPDSGYIVAEGVGAIYYRGIVWNLKECPVDIAAELAELLHCSQVQKVEKPAAAAEKTGTKERP